VTIATLIDKQDNVEIIRDQIAAILAIESAAQVALAVAAAKPDPDEWKLRVYQERANPWEAFPPKTTDTSPVVNVWWDSSNFDMAASNIIERQKSPAIINIDCYGYGKSAGDGGGGHIAGDQKAAEVAQRAVRLVRNILMAAEYTYLGLRGTVWRRWTNSITLFQPQQGNQFVEQVVAGRIAFQVEFNEFSPQVVPETLELLTADIHRAEDGQLIVETDYDYTA
jgi:hypothetical protein